jgi:hypothetical protein
MIDEEDPFAVRQAAHDFHAVVMNVNGFAIVVDYSRLTHVEHARMQDIDWDDLRCNSQTFCSRLVRDC